MIREVSGDILDFSGDVLVNPVNCEGVMGRGLAAQFARAWPRMLLGYQRDCRSGVLRPGRLNVYAPSTTPPVWVVNLPTKDRYRNPSELEYIESGLVALRDVLPALGARSVAVPALGCGCGGLHWEPVRELIVTALGDLDSIDVVVYPPENGAPQYP